MRAKDIFSQTYFDFERFAILSKSSHENYIRALPFPHLILDGLFNESFLQSVVEEFPDTDSSIWQRSEDENQVKLRSIWEDESDMSDSAIIATRILNSGKFLKSLCVLTGIEGLIPDYYYTGGGLNKILPGGKLNIHVDGTTHDFMQLHRRVNVILFLNKGWKDEWGGFLELWKDAKGGPEVSIRPDFNRLVIFTTNDFTYHGHPHPLTCPPGNSRKSIIQYYYTQSRPEGDIVNQRKHRAIFVKNQ